MKNVFKKAVSLTVALSTVAALSVSAFADEIAKGTAKYDADTQAVKVTGYGDATDDTALADGQYAVAVVPADFTGEDADIYYVNQADEKEIVTIISNMLLKGALNTELDYEVRIGNNANSDINVIPVTFETTPEGVQITLNYGDVNGDDSVDNVDAGLVLQKYAQLIKVFTDQESREVPVTIGDVNGDNSVDNVDAGLILQKYAKLINGFTDQNGEPLTTHTYTYVVK